MPSANLKGLFDHVLAGMADVFTFGYIDDKLRNVFGMVADAFYRFGDKKQIQTG